MNQKSVCDLQMQVDAFLLQVDVLAGAIVTAVQASTGI